MEKWYILKMIPSLFFCKESVSNTESVDYHQRPRQKPTTNANCTSVWNKIL